jgi:LacI family transcriptional regulator
MAKATINDVARLAGVSKKTVSFVINGRDGIAADTRARVEEVIAALGFVPSIQGRAFASGTTATIALLHDPSAEDREGWLAQAIAGAQAGLAGTGLALVVQPGGTAASLRDFLEGQRPGGVMFLPPLSGRPVLAALCREMGTPCQRLAPAADGDPAGVISGNDRQAARDAANYLLAMGHARIGFIAGDENEATAHERERGFGDALGDDAGLVAQGDGSFASGLAAARLLLELSPRPTAILAAGPAMAAGALAAAREAGLAVPQALSVMALGDVAHAAHLHPPLSAMRTPVAAMAEAAVKRLLAPAVSPPAEARFYAELAGRDSSGPAPLQSG